MDEPTQPAEPTAEAKRAGGFAGYFVWPFVIVVLYFLSAGPLATMLWKRPLSKSAFRFIGGFYTPWRLVYLHTPLHKPLGMYMHLWNPQMYDSAGDVNPKPF